MPSVSDDYVRKRLLEQPRFELAAKGVFKLGCYIFWQGVPGLRASNWESTATSTNGCSLDRWHQKTISACRTKRPSARKTAYWHERSKIRRCTSVKNSECQPYRAYRMYYVGHVWDPTEVGQSSGEMLVIHNRPTCRGRMQQTHWTATVVCSLQKNERFAAESSVACYVLQPSIAERQQLQPQSLPCIA